MATASQKVLELTGLIKQDDPAAWVSNLWEKWNQQRQPKLTEWSEVEKYLFATDTNTTSNKTLPWTHNTTAPKLTQIRDNLHANYISSLFPNDKWLSWVAYTKDAAKRVKADTIRAYMENKTREGGFRTTVSHLLYDYIDYGNAFAMPTFEIRYKTTQDSKTIDFIGPKCVRINPYDIVFDPTAAEFESSNKIVRSLQSVGTLKKLAMTDPSQRFWKDALDRRDHILENSTKYSTDDWYKASQYQVDGFGNLQEYYGSNLVEVLEFYGDWHDEDGNIQENRMVTIVDRSIVVRNEPIDSYGGKPLIRHVGWRLRSNNLWAMGPLDNLVGMQYMIDHYLNMGANALDLKVMSPKKIIGEVEEFVWGPNEEIHIDSKDSDVQEMAQSMNDIFTVRDWIEQLEYRMELYAGAPREAMGIRTPGEKTAFEVQSLENASGRIFGEKIVQFELFMEQILNDMLEVSHRNFDEEDVIRVVDNDIGVVQFKQITKEDITANGILRPIGARHFAQKAQEVQNLIGILNSPLGQILSPHMSGIATMHFVEDVVNLRGYNMFQKHVAVAEQQELQALAGQAAEDNEVKAQMSEEDIMLEAPPNAE